MKINKLFNIKAENSNTEMVNIFPAYDSELPPFSSDCIVVPPNKKTKEHKHDERESFLILKGKGIIHCDGTSTDVEAGDIIHFRQFESHSLNNTGEEDLYFLTLYWRDYKGAFEVAANKSQGPIDSKEIVYIIPTPPTPNGDLHLGHISGPYLGADVCTRYLKMKGVEAYNISGSDDFQTGVLTKSKQLGKTPEQTADRFAEEMKLTLDNMNIKLDAFIRPLHSEEYKRDFSNFFYELWEKNVFLDEESTVFFDEKNNVFIHEGEVKGNCPNCNEKTSGNLCEECGHPNSCIDIVNPVSMLSQSVPITRKLRRLLLPLDKYVDNLKSHHDQTSMRSRLRALFDQLKNNGMLKYAITYPSKWGLPATIKGFEGHVISAWFEMTFGFLFCIREIERIKKKESNELTIPPNARIVHFFGFDNSFYYTALYPAVYFNAFPNQQLKIDYICNEFFLLDGLKFSTSREHAIWGAELLKEVSADEIRFYLCYNRPEFIRTNFTREDFYKVLNNELSNKWRSWLINIDTRIKNEFNGIVPEAGLWTHEQKIFFGKLDYYIKEISASYSISSFSLQRACHLLCDYVDEATLFAKGEKYWINTRNCEAEHRTSITLEITAAKLFALLVHPIMPNLSETLWQQLGNKEKVQDFGWPKTPPFAVSNSIIDLSNITINAEYVPKK
jgi:methionyl-tRNA synthetase